MSIELLLAHADDQRPVLEDGLPVDAAGSAPRPAQKVSAEDFRHDGGDPNDLHDQRWGLIVPDGPAGDRLLEVIEPLKKWREEQQGAEAIVFRAPPRMGTEEASTWWSEVYLNEDIDDADRPRYLLALGDADVLSWDLQQRLASDTFIGRLCFPEEAGYEAYVHKLLACERGEPAAGSRALYYTVRDGTAATNVGYAGLMTPTIEQSRLGRDKGVFNAREVVEIGEGTNVSLDDFLAAVSSPEPSMLFSISHGCGAPRAGWKSAEEQRLLQGAMSFGGGARLAAEDVASRPFLPGGLWFFFACFGAGTPHGSAYHHWLAMLRDVGLYGRNIDAVLKSLPGDQERPFVAALPQAALANPNGPLAVMGHVDLAWTFSFQDVGTTNKYRASSRFQDIFRTIVDGKRVGAGYFELQRFFNQASVDLGALYDQDARMKARGSANEDDKARKIRKATLWMLRQDLSAYVLLGDPAARLNIEGPLARARAPRVEAPEVRAARAKVPEVKAPAPPPSTAPVSLTSSPDVFLLRVAPRPGVASAELERTLIENAKTFVLAARPKLPPDSFSHRVLAGSSAGYTWQIGVDGIDRMDDDEAPVERLEDALLPEVRARLNGVAEVISVEASTDLLTPPPGLGFTRVSLGPDGPAAFAGEDDLPAWQDYAHDSGTPEAGRELPSDLLAEIERSRAAVPAEPELKKWGNGHIYFGHSDKAHLAYLNAYFDRRAASASPADRRRIIAFRTFQGREGSTAAINSYDNQIVTWGTGWGGLGLMGKVVERAMASRAVRDLFGSCGVRYRGKNTYDVVDLEAKLVVTGKREALEALRRSVPLLCMLIHAARAPETRDAVTEAQLATFMGNAADIGQAGAIETQALFNLIAHLRHWAPGYAIGCVEWALPQVEAGAPSLERDKRLAVLVSRYFYGKAKGWIPDWKQFQLYWKHMKQDGLDCLSDPFIQASAPPPESPFGSTGANPAQAVAQGAAAASSSPGSAPALKHAPLAGLADLEAIARGRGALRVGSKGAGVKAAQEALIKLGIEVPGGADGSFGKGLVGAVKAFQEAHKLADDGILGPGTLKAMDAALGSV